MFWRAANSLLSKVWELLFSVNDLYDSRRGLVFTLSRRLARTGMISLLNSTVVLFIR